jgi:hypothetical protein
MNSNSIVGHRSGLVATPADFADPRPPSYFGAQLSSVQNDPSALKKFLWSERATIGKAREAAFTNVTNSDQVIYGNSTKKFLLDTALARNLDIPYAQVKYLSPLPAFSASVPPRHVVTVHRTADMQAQP